MNNADLHTSSGRFHEHVPLLILVLCLTVLGIGIYRKTTRAIAPPIYDPMAYYTKGALVWREWSHGRLVNPLNVGPTFRPPGTMLLTSPLGFSPDFRAFFFRSIYFPVAVFVLGFWVLAESQVRQLRQRWANLVGALMLASLPMFYQFERNSAIASPSDWGYMDCFLGALAALATALLIVSVQRCSVGLATMGVVTGALTLLVKPAGLVLLPVFCFLWVTELLAAHWPTRAGWREDRMLKRYSISTASLLVVIFGATTAACFGSEYLSRTNIRLASNSLNIVIDMFRNVSLWSLVAPQVHTSFGWHWFYVSIVVALLLLGAIMVRASRHAMRREDFRFLAALVALCLGAVWWTKFAGPAMIRYLYPFPMIFLVVLLPGILAATDRVLPQWSRRALAAPCVVPMAIILALLFIDAPPIKWQSLVGVNLSAGQFRQEVQMGDLVADQARHVGHNLKLYVIPMDARPGVVEAEGIYRNLLHPEAPTFQIQRPNDWIRTIMVRRSEVVQADFLLFYPVRDANRRQAILAQPVVNDPTTESDVFSAWLTQASGEQGLQTMSDGVLRLVRVVDHAKLDQAFGDLVTKHNWRDLFYAENNEPALLTRDALLSAVDRSVPDVRNVRFGSRFLLSSVRLTPKDRGLQMELFWESLAEQPMQFIIFVHLIDPSGKMLAQADYEQSPGARTAPRLAKAGEIWRDTVQLSHDQLRGATGIAFGIWEPPGTFLTADRGVRDWDNRRLILPVPRDLSRSGSDTSAHYEGRLEHAGCDVISGWAWNAAAPDEAIKVQLLDGSKPLVTVIAGSPRPDLKAAGKGNGSHAFVLALPVMLRDGRLHSIVGKANDSSFELANSPQALTCKSE